MKNTYSLPININKEAHLTFHLIMLLRKDLYPWFYENFINIFIQGKEYNIIDFLDNVDESFKFLVDEQITYSNAEILSADPIILAKSYLSKNFYTAVWVDKYFIPGAVEFNSYHYVHPIVLYGYDDVEQSFSLVNFSWDKGIVTNKIRYDSLPEAIVNAERYYKQGGREESVIKAMLCIKEKVNYNRKNFDIVSFLEEFKNYLYSIPGKIKSRYQLDSNGGKWYGLKVYERLIHILKHVDNGYEVAFKSISDFALHKKYIYDRLIYIKNNYNLPEEYREKINRYENVKKLTERIKLLNIKYATLDKTNPASFSKNPQFIEKAINILSEAENLEYEILFPIYQYLSFNVSHASEPDVKAIVDFVQRPVCVNNKNYLDIQFENESFVQRVDIYTGNSELRAYPMGKLILSDKSQYLISEFMTRGGVSYNLFFEPKKISGFEYIPSSPVDDLNNIISFKIYGFANEKMWDFSTETNYEWTAVHDIESVDISNKLVCKISGRDPNILCNNVNIYAKKAKYIYIKYSSVCISETAQLFFSTTDSHQLSEDKSKIISISPYDCAMEYIFDMSDNSEWRDGILTLRFDPTGYDYPINGDSDKICEIEYIKVSDKMPAYNNRECFCKSQGVNGWFYYTYNNGITYREMNYNANDESWRYETCQELYIKKNEQNSYNHMSTVRRFVCPAAGNYRISYKVSLLSENRNSYFTVKQNHRVIFKYKLLEWDGKNNIDLTLEYGEALNFEFYNEDENTLEKIGVNIDIIKLDD